MPNSSVADVLARAAEVIDESGWVQDLHELGGAHCAVGALLVACDLPIGHDRWNDVLKGAVAALREFLDIPPHGSYTIYGPHKADRYAIAQWNNEHDRTQFEVTNALRKCAEQLRSETTS